MVVKLGRLLKVCESKLLMGWICNGIIVRFRQWKRTVTDLLVSKAHLRPVWVLLNLIRYVADLILIRFLSRILMNQNNGRLTDDLWHFLNLENGMRLFRRVWGSYQRLIRCNILERWFLPSLRFSCGFGRIVEAILLSMLLQSWCWVI